MKTLDQIGREEESDRSSLHHNYFAQYESIFEQYRDLDIDIIEIGGRVANSARVWSRYFPNARLHVVDTNPVDALFEVPRVEVHHVDLINVDALAEVASQIRPNIVIDDGTHLWSHQLAAIEGIYPSLRPGGIYIVEDLQTNYGAYVSTHGDTLQSTASFLFSLASGLLAGSQGSKLGEAYPQYLLETLARIEFLKQSAVLYKSVSSERLVARGSLSESRYALTVITRDSEPYERVRGQLLDAPKSKEAAFSEIQSNSPARLGPAVSGIIRDATVYGGGMVVTEDDLAVNETLNNIEKIPEYAGFRKQPDGNSWVTNSAEIPDYVAKVEGEQHVLLKGAWDANYGHWLYDVLPRLELLGDLDLSARPKLVINPQKGAMVKVVQETIELAGFDLDQVVEHNGNPRKYESLAVLGRTSTHPVLKAPAATRFLERITSRILPGEQKRIYLSRNAYNRRRLVNEDSLASDLVDHGFEIIYPEQLSFEQQVALLKGAEIVAGNMGAAFTNLAFSQPGIKVLALATTAMPHDFFYDIVCHKHGNYVGVQGTTRDPSPGMGSDFSISREQLLRGLEAVGA